MVAPVAAIIPTHKGFKVVPAAMITASQGRGNIMVTQERLIKKIPR